jgi:hypothetical protein
MPLMPWQTMNGENPNEPGSFQPPTRPTKPEHPADYRLPSGYLNPYSSEPFFKRRYAPHLFVADMINNPDVENYANVSDVASAQGVDAIRGGEARATTAAKRTAGQSGLGRGYAGQMETDIRQEGTQGAAQAMMGAELEERARRANLQMMFTQALMESNKSRYAAYLAEKARKSGQQAGNMQMVGQIGGAIIGGAAGFFAGGPVGAVAGASLGAKAGGSIAGGSAQGSQSGLQGFGGYS